MISGISFGSTAIGAAVVYSLTCFLTVYLSNIYGAVVVLFMPFLFGLEAF